MGQRILHNALQKVVGQELLNHNLYLSTKDHAELAKICTTPNIMMDVLLETHGVTTHF